MSATVRHWRRGNQHDHKSKWGVKNALGLALICQGLYLQHDIKQKMVRSLEDLGSTDYVVPDKDKYTFKLVTRR